MPKQPNDLKPGEVINKKVIDQPCNDTVPDTLYHSILENSLVGILRFEPIIMTDSNGKIKFWNPGSEKLFGYSYDKMLGTNIQNLFCDQQFNQIYPLSINFSDSEKGLEQDQIGKVYELTARGRFISSIPLEVSVSYHCYQGQTYAVLIARNITERILQIEELQKAKDEAVKANRLKSEFLSNMSHEIRTPMNAILGFAAITLNCIENEEHKEYLRIIQKSGENLLRLLNDILDLSKIEAERMILQQKEFSMRKLMNEVYEIFSLQASQKNIKFLSEISDDTPDKYIGDEHRLRQILINFLSNAFKFTSENGTVRVCFFHRKDKGYFEISDTGIGIPQDKINTILNAFVQVDGTFTRQYSGTGLGLAITRRLVELMEGKIEVTSEEKKGSTFKFHVKMLVSQETDADLESEYSADRKFRHILKSTENYRKGVSMVRKWIQFAEGDVEIEDIICEAITLLPGKLEELMVVINNKDEKKLDFLSHSLKGETLNLHMNDIAKHAKKMNDVIRQKPPDWVVIQEELEGLKELISLIPPGYLERHPVKYSTEKISRQDTILVAEDNAMNQKLMKTIIEKLGFACEVANNGLIALNMLMENEYFMLLLDMQMPVMDGMELIKIIRDDVHIKDLYVVAVTAHAMKGDKELFMEAGCNDYLAKPIEFDKLSKVIENTLKNNQKANENTDS